jgi:ABC-type branched-subunit amino acid transport system permease subunit/aromatic ring-opening dioxygenase catalytic subunit (LigB family)
MIGAFINAAVAGRRGYGLVALLLIALLVLPPLVGANSYLTYLVMTFFIFAAFGHAWNLMAGYAGLLSFGNQVYVGIGGFALAMLTYYGKVNVWLALPISAVIAALFAWLQVVPLGARWQGKRVLAPVAVAVALWIVYEILIASDPSWDVFQGDYVRRVMILFLIFVGALPLLRLQGAYFAVATWLIAAAMSSIFNEWQLVGAGGGMRVASQSSLELRYYVGLLLLVASTGAIWYVLRSRYGLALTAVRDDEEAAAAVGVDVRYAKALVFVLSALITALAGGLYFIDQITLTPQSAFSLFWSAYFVFVVVAGGIGTLAGPIVGAAIYVLVDRILAAWIDQGLLVLGIAAVLLILLLPRGVVGAIEMLRAQPAGPRRADGDGAKADIPAADGGPRRPPPPGVVAAYLVPGTPLPMLAPANPPWAPIVAGYAKLRTALESSGADTLLVYSTQWMAVLDELWQTRQRLTGVHVDENWYEFGDLPYDIRIDTELAQAAVARCAAASIHAKGVDYDAFPIDTGTIVATTLLNPNGRLPVVVAANNIYHDFATTERLAAFAVEEARRLGRRVAVIGVGGLSSAMFRTDIDIRQDHVAGRTAEEWDHRMMDLMEKGDVAGLRAALPAYCQEANPDMGLKHLAWLLGAAGDRIDGAVVHAYGPAWGSGNAVVEFKLR